MPIYRLIVAADGRLASASIDGMVRLYDRNFKLVVPPRKAPGGEPFRIAFSPPAAGGWLWHVVDGFAGGNMKLKCRSGCIVVASGALARWNGTAQVVEAVVAARIRSSWKDGKPFL